MDFQIQYLNKILLVCQFWSKYIIHNICYLTFGLNKKYIKHLLPYIMKLAFILYGFLVFNKWI
jgi:hypothetical protein